MKHLLPYLLPALTILLLFSFLIFNPSITGFATTNYETKIRLSTYENIILPEDAVLLISINNQSSNITVKEFIKKTKQEFNLTNGTQGQGFTGNYTYFLTLKQFKIKDQNGNLSINITYTNQTISNQTIEINGI